LRIKRNKKKLVEQIKLAQAIRRPFKLNRLAAEPILKDKNHKYKHFITRLDKNWTRIQKQINSRTGK
jgi:hypothetical protein